MAIFDAMFEFMDDAELTGSSATLYLPVSTWKELNWGASGLEMGAGEPVWLNIRVGTTAYESGTTDTDTVDFKLFADAATSGHDSDSSVVMATGPRQVSTLIAGAWVIRQPLPVNVDDKQFLVVGAEFSDNISTGTINAWLDHGPQSSYDTQVSTSNIT